MKDKSFSIGTSKMAMPVHSDIANHDPQYPEEADGGSAINGEALDVVVLLLVLGAILYLVWCLSRVLLDRCCSREIQPPEEPDTTGPPYFRFQ